MKLLSILPILAAFQLSAFAQVQSSQEVLKVLDQDSVRIDGASVKINQLGKEWIVLTNNAGLVNLLIDSTVGFSITVSHVAFETVIKKYDIPFNPQDLLIILKPKSKELTEVKVVAEKPFISIDKNKIILSIDKNMVAGQSVVDILKKAPGITIQNNIILFEGKPITAQMKGKNIRLSVANLTEFLGGTSASSIDEIEIITVPLSNTDASVTGALINLKPIKILDNGFRGSINTKLGTRSKFGNGGLSGWGNFKKDNLTGFVSLGYSKDFQNSVTDIERHFTPTIYNKTTDIKEVSKGVYKPESIPITLSLEYAINKKNQIGVVVNGMLSNTSTEQNSNSAIYINTPPANPADSLITMNSLEKRKNRSGSVDLFYKIKLDSTGQEFNFDIAYSKVRSKSENDQLYNYYLNDGSAYQTPSSLDQSSILDLITKSIQLDYVKPLKKVKLEAGFKQSWTGVDQNLDQRIESQRNPSVVNELLTYDENITAGYLTLSGTLKGSLAFSVGARGENTTIKSFPINNYNNLNRTYFRLFPTVLLSKKIGATSLTVSYRNNIVRPRFSRLANFKFYLSPFYYFTGNPALQPYFQNTVRTSWSLKNKFQLTASYTWHKNNMLEFAELDTLNGVTKGLIANNGNFKNFVLNPNYSANLYKWWYTNSGISISQRHLNFTSDEQAVSIHNTNFSVNSSNTFTISKSIKCEVYAYYNSGTFYNAAKTGEYWFVDFSIFKNVLKGAGQLSLSVNDVFYSNISRTEAKYALISYSSSNKWDSRNIVLSFNYGFGSKNYKTRQLRRNSAVDDIKSRSN